MLQKGSPKDRYDFLDLYLRAWERVANKIYRKCFPEEARKLAADLSKAFDDEKGDFLHDVETNGHERGLEEEFPLHDPRFQKEPSQPRSISKHYYDRKWHPYDWYIKANTEVRTTCNKM